MGLEKMNPRTFIIVIAISLGVALASYGELNLFVPNFISTTAEASFFTDIRLRRDQRLGWIRLPSSWNCV
jgi:hypothetical protein